MSENCGVVLCFVKSISSINAEIVACELCPRLRQHCKKVAHDKRKSFASDEYWGKPVPSFGDVNADVLVVGLAPSAHGANRTGRMFTGDHSGLWLYRALSKAGFANEVGLQQNQYLANRGDGLILTGVMITAVAHCAPPENKPTSEEIENCSRYLYRELDALKNLKVFIVLGQIALKGLWQVLPVEWKPTKVLPKFSHGAKINLKNGMVIVCSYHPSQQNTFTKKLTEPMFDRIFIQARGELSKGF